MGKVTTNLFIFNDNNFLCIAEYHTKFSIVMEIERPLAEYLKKYVKIIFVRYRIISEIVPDIGTNSLSEKFTEFSRKLNIEQDMSSSYNHLSNRNEEACI